MHRPRTPLQYFLLMLAIYAVWVALYFTTAWIGALRGPAFDAGLPLDARIPYLPGFQYAYVLCYVVPLGLFFVDREPAFLNRAYAAFIAANACAFLVFALFPVEGPVRELSSQDATPGNFVIALITSVDSRYNAFPSLHVANPWLVALLCVERRGWTLRSALFVTVAVLISAATLFVRQHYILDVAAGMVLAFTTLLLFRAFWKTGRRVITAGDPA